MQKSLQVFDVDSYEFRVKENSATSMKRDAVLFGDHFNSDATRPLDDGIQRLVGAVLLVHRLEHEHVLLLHETESDSFRLPGGKINEGERIEDCLHRTMRMDLAPHDFPEIAWRVQGCLGCWWRPQFTSKEMPLVLSQVSRPKEVGTARQFQFVVCACSDHTLTLLGQSVKIYAVQLPDAFVFHTTESSTLMAVPLFSIMDDATRYGPVLASLPYLISQLEITKVRLLPN
jgi:hypothetical protein